MPILAELATAKNGTSKVDEKRAYLRSLEELVGCHGGLGGWQTRPLLVHPAAWSIDVDLLDSGCCGMAGSFGYEKEHYDVSMQIGNLVLFPAIKKLIGDVIIAASGTS